MIGIEFGGQYAETIDRKDAKGKFFSVQLGRFLFSIYFVVSR